MGIAAEHHAASTPIALEDFMNRRTFVQTLPAVTLLAHGCLGQQLAGD